MPISYCISPSLKDDEMNQEIPSTKSTDTWSRSTQPRKVPWKACGPKGLLLFVLSGFALVGGMILSSIHFFPAAATLAGPPAETATPGRPLAPKPHPTSPRDSSARIAVGPYVQNMGTERATVCWASREGESRISGPDEVRTVPRYAVHELLLGNLKPATRYHYDVLSDGSKAGQGSFTTFPSGQTPFHFVVVGDTRTNHKTYQAIVDQIITEKPLLVVNTGDLVSDGLDIRKWVEFFRISSRLMRSIPYYPVLGNHEDNAAYYFNFFSLPQNERYYSFSVGDALFLILDEEGAYHETPAYMDEQARKVWWKQQNLQYMQRQKVWVERMLALNESAGYTFVFLHEPLISVMHSRVEDARRWRAFWGGLFEKHHVSVVFSGHDHFYHHAVVQGTQYITTAGGGAGLYNPDTPAPETVLIKRVNHYCRVDVGPKQAQVTAIELGGAIIEKVPLRRRH